MCKLKLTLLLVLVSSLANALRVEAAAPETQKGPLGNKPERLEWLQDAGFGMFIHWSLDSQIGSVISHSMAGASDEYLDWYIHELPKTFHPDRWNPDKIARLAKLCGIQYVVLTAKHHSGFCLWNTKTTEFNIANTPYGQTVLAAQGRDLLTEYTDALRKNGLAVGLYYSPEDFHWLHENGHTIRRRNLDPDPDTDPKYSQFIRSQVTELFSHYGSIDVLFIDGAGSEPTKEVAWTLQPDCLITRGAIETPEQYVPGKPPEGPWESCLTMGTQWQYKPTNDDYKSGSRLIELLIETRAKGGALLLNVGPKPDGALPIEQEERLREIALWHAVNGEAIHNTRPWVVANEESIWFTKRKNTNTVYAFLTRIPDWSRGARKEFLVQSVQATSKTTVSVLGHAGKLVEYSPSTDATPRHEQTDEGLRISVVRGQRLYNNNKWHNPVVVRLDHVKPAFDIPPYAETGRATAHADGRIVFDGRLVELAGAPSVDVGIEYQVYGGFAEAMYNTDWSCTELKQMSAPGVFAVTVDGLRPGAVYQYRAVVKHPKATMRGDHKRVLVKR